MPENETYFFVIYMYFEFNPRVKQLHTAAITHR